MTDKNNTSDSQSYEHNHKELLQEFSQTTTFHGVKYIFQEEATIYRRLLWLLAWFTSTVLFSILIKQKLDLYFSYPSAIEINEERAEILKFPAVTVCNKYPFKISLLHKTGLYDASRIPSVTESSDYNEYYYNESICTIPQHSRFHQTIVSTSIATCMRLCNDADIYEIKCLGLIWYNTNNTCIITSYDGNNAMQNCSKITSDSNEIMYLKKIRQMQIHRRPIYCTFDDEEDTGACPLFPDHRLAGTWKTDFHERAIFGRSFQVWMSNPTFQPYARFWTPLLNTTNKCLLFFSSEFGSNIILSVSSEYSSETIDESKVFQLFRFTRQQYFVYLPAGLHKIYLTVVGNGQRPTGVSIDDFSIRPCEDFKRECLLSTDSLAYMGTASISTYKNRTCEPWRNYEYIFYSNYYKLLNMTSLLYNVSSLDTNYCRHILDNDETKTGLYCVIEKFRKLCNPVPYCDCARGWFKCKSGQCIPKNFFCNGKVDCSDASDEDKAYCKQALQNSHKTFGLGRPDEDLNLYDKTQLNISSNKNRLAEKLFSFNMMSMSAFINKTSFRSNQSILKCLWLNDEECLQEIEERFTDMGLCYTFNSNSSSVFRTDRSGEQASGLYLLVNMASYEIMQNGDSNMGMKLLLFDPEAETEIMWDRGIHIMPGFLTSIEISTEIGYYLEQPYGRCSSLPLIHTNDSYSYTRCVRDKQTDHFVERCGCRNYYMSGEASECSASQYFMQCQNLSQTFTNFCPSDCRQTSYQQTLSLSVVSRENFMSLIGVKKVKEIQDQLMSALEMQCRTDENKFTIFLRTFDNLFAVTLHLLTFIDEEFIKNSAFTFNFNYYLEDELIWRQYTHFVSSYYRNNIADYQQLLQEYVKHYLKYASILQVQAVNFSTFANNVITNYTAVTTNITAKESVKRVSELKEWIQNVRTTSYELIDWWKIIKRYLDRREINRLFCERRSTNSNGVKFFYPTCNNALVHLSELIDEYYAWISRFDYSLRSIYERNEQLNASYASFLIAKSIVNIDEEWSLANFTTDFFQTSSILSQCFDQYNSLLDQMFNLTEIARLTQSFLHNRFSSVLLSNRINSLRAAQAEVSKTLQEYLENKLTRKLAGDRLSLIIEELSANIAQVKHLFNTQLYGAWLDSVRIQSDYIVDHFIEIFTLTRNFYNLCESSNEDYFTKSFLHPFLQEFVSTHPYAYDEIFYNALLTSTNDTIMLSESVSVNVTATIHEHFFIHRTAEVVTEKVVLFIKKCLSQLNLLEKSLDQIKEQIIAYNRSLEVNENFVKENIVAIKIYFREIKVRYVKQNVSYSMFSLFSDIGGSIGLLLGASILSLLEIFDYWVIYFFRKFRSNKPARHQNQPHDLTEVNQLNNLNKATEN